MSQILDFVALHNHCARVATEGRNPADVFGEPDAGGYRESLWGGRIHDSKYEAFLAQCVATIAAWGMRNAFAASWNKDRGR